MRLATLLILCHKHVTAFCPRNMRTKYMLVKIIRKISLLLFLSSCVLLRTLNKNFRV
jgi:hypothetical protein